MIGMVEDESGVFEPLGTGFVDGLASIGADILKLEGLLLEAVISEVRLI